MYVRPSLIDDSSMIIADFLVPWNEYVFFQLGYSNDGSSRTQKNVKFSSVSIEISS